MFSVFKAKSFHINCPPASSYLARLEEQNPGLVHPGILPALERLAQSITGADRSQLQLERCVDPALTDFAMLRDRTVRKKVAGYVKRLQETDTEIFKYLRENKNV